MKFRVKYIANWLERWGLKIAWLAAVAVLVTAAVAAWLGRTPSTSLSQGAIDSLQLIDAPGLQRIDYRGYRAYYNPQWHMPACTIYELTPAEALGELPRARYWFTDTACHGSAVDQDYVNTGYDRGHMAPSSDMKWDSVAMQQSFFMTNVCPQDRTLNQGGWARLEDKVREWTERDGNLIVITGPIVTPADTATIGKTRVRVPSAFFKIILAHQVDPIRAAAFIYPNRPCDAPLSTYATTIAHIESLTHLTFFPTLPSSLKTTSNLTPWLH